MSLSLSKLVTDFAQAVQAVDSHAPVAVSLRTRRSYQPGIGPHTEARAVKLVMAHLADAEPQRYGSYRLGVPYGDGTRQTCDVCLGGPEARDWAVEAKILRLIDGLIHPVHQRGRVFGWQLQPL